MRPGRLVPLLSALALSAALSAALALPAAATAAPPVDAVSRFAPVGAPGHADSSLLLPGGDVLVSTNRSATAPLAPGGPSALFRYDATGRLVRTYHASGQNLGGEHGLMSMVLDGEGRVYVADYSPPRVLRFDLRTGAQETYATIPDLTGAQGNGVGQSAPWPDGLAFLRDGTLLVTDLAQGTVFAVPPGGAPRVWLQGPELRSRFGANNVVVTPDGSLLLDTTASLTTASLGAPTAQSGPGVLYRVPVAADGTAGQLQQLYATRPGEGPDGFALGASGRIYLCALVTDTVVVLAPGGSTEERRITTPTAAPGTARLDSPSSATFVGDHLLVTNLTYFSGSAADDALLRIDVDDRAVPVPTPLLGGAGPATGGPPAPAPTGSTHKKAAPARAASTTAGRSRVAARPPLRGATPGTAQPTRALAFTGGQPLFAAAAGFVLAAGLLLRRRRAARPTTA